MADTQQGKTLHFAVQRGDENVCNRSPMLGWTVDPPLLPGVAARGFGARCAGPGGRCGRTTRPRDLVRGPAARRGGQHRHRGCCAAGLDAPGPRRERAPRQHPGGTRGLWAALLLPGHRGVGDAPPERRGGPRDLSRLAGAAPSTRTARPTRPSRLGTAHRATRR